MSPGVSMCFLNSNDEKSQFVKLTFEVHFMLRFRVLINVTPQDDL